MATDAGKRIRQRREAKKDLSRIFEAPDNVCVIHYSCESFYDRNDGTSPRVTSIAARNLRSGQTSSFSIHQVAERDEEIAIDAISQNYDSLERQMLKEFYEFVGSRQNVLWLHWNMRDVNYGFQALEHRYRVLGGQNVSEIQESNKIDLARVLIALYGVRYIGHPRLTKLVELNKITDMGFLGGNDEASAFENGNYVGLHQSTLRKVDVMANIAHRVVDGTLKTQAKRREIYGGYFQYFFHEAKDHWIIVLLGIVASCAGIYSVMPQ